MDFVNKMSDQARDTVEVRGVQLPNRIPIGFGLEPCSMLHILLNSERDKLATWRAHRPG